jgi:hypothetical protein
MAIVFCPPQQRVGPSARACLAPLYPQTFQTPWSTAGPHHCSDERLGAHFAASAEIGIQVHWQCDERQCVAVELGGSRKEEYKAVAWARRCGRRRLAETTQLLSDHLRRRLHSAGVTESSDRLQQLRLGSSVMNKPSCPPQEPWKPLTYISPSHRWWFRTPSVRVSPMVAHRVQRLAPAAEIGIQVHWQCDERQCVAVELGGS